MMTIIEYSFSLSIPVAGTVSDTAWVIARLTRIKPSCNYCLKFYLQLKIALGFFIYFLLRTSNKTVVEKVETKPKINKQKIPNKNN